MASRVDCIVCVDACFTQKRSKNPGGAEGDDPPNPITSFFVPTEVVDEMESLAEQCRTQGHSGRVVAPDGIEDVVEEGMHVPVSVLDGCRQSFIAGDERQEKASTQFFADTGLMALLCRHDHVLWLVNLTSAREKQHYALALLKQFIAHIPDDMRVGFLYDIGYFNSVSPSSMHMVINGLVKSYTTLKSMKALACQMVKGVSAFGAC
ncbi:hypothetical protein BDN67DRAFT_1016497 [Paxillus ammoniavirescens]|nr:hypothetical protein BDN67DRAFT_1016497 [Paxillus ammoniavirescens]